MKNPVLRKTIAKITTIAQAAIVGGINVEVLVNQLRDEVGQNVELFKQWFRHTLLSPGYPLYFRFIFFLSSLAFGILMATSCIDESFLN